MTGQNRLPAPNGRLIDRDRPVTFSFEGRRYTGYAGDTVASALAANDVWLLSRSFKYHRPRGVMTMAGQDGNTLIALPGRPNCVAELIPIREGLVAAGQHYSGSLQRDRNAWIQWFSRFLPAGFYYHAFFRPRGVWNLWSRYFRRMSGLGVLDEHAVPGDCDKQYRHCDVAVIGAGPAGMQAAIDAARDGGDVLLIDEQDAAGGSLHYARACADGAHEARQLRTFLDAVRAVPGIELMTGATVNGWYADHWLEIIRGNRLIKLRAGRVVLCSGTIEQPALFRNNDLPGIMLGTAAQRLIKPYGVRPGRRAVVLAADDSAYGVALDLIDADVDLAAVVDQRDRPPSDARTDQVREAGIEVLAGHAIQAARGRRHVRSVEVRRIVAPGRLDGRSRRIDCDLVCMSVGRMPAWQLACQAGARLVYEPGRATFALADLPEGFTLGGSVASGCNDGGAPCPIFPHPGGNEFVDLDEDLQIRDIRHAVQSGYEHIQLVKRYSTSGMGPSQGRLSALATARLVAAETGRSLSDTGVTTARPPLAAVTLAHCAGRRHYPALRSSIHHRHVEAGAQFLQAGAWCRPAYYGGKDEFGDAVTREVLAVRNGAGAIDVSTLGGIAVRGPDAAEFLNRIHTFAYARQRVGTLRYALMTNEAGFVIDDGVVCRLDDRDFYVTTTTGGAERVFRTMLHWNAQWRLDVSLANLTSAYCGVSVVGPRSREVLAGVDSDIDFGREAFPYLGVRRGNVAGAPAIVLRTGFVGELGYEVHAPQHCGEALWDTIMSAGAGGASGEGNATGGIRPVGIEAQRILRLEKGHVLVGQDTDALSTPMELNMRWAIAARKPFFVGKRSLKVHDSRPPERVLAGFRIEDPAGAVPRECHLLVDAQRLIGRVTSVARSPALNKIVGLAYVPPDRAEPGSRLTIRCDRQRRVTAQVVRTPFYDPGNARQEL